MTSPLPGLRRAGLPGLAAALLGLASWPATPAGATQREAAQAARPVWLQVRGVDDARAPGTGPVWLDGNCVASVEVRSNPAGGAPVLSVGFTAAGTRRLADLTRAATGQRIAFVLAEAHRTRVLAVSVVRQPIDSGQLDLPLSGMSPSDAHDLARRLRASLALPDAAIPRPSKGHHAPSARPGSP